MAQQLFPICIIGRGILYPKYKSIETMDQVRPQNTSLRLFIFLPPTFVPSMSNCCKTNIPWIAVDEN
jgi:hypothetical protein